MPLSKFEANPTLRLRRASFCLFPLASSCLNDYFRTYAIIKFLANRLVFPNTVTYVEPMIFRFLRKPKRNLGFGAEFPVRT